jgi:hypothetical protein
VLSVGIESQARASEVPFRRGDRDGPFEVKKAKGIRRNDSNLSYQCRLYGWDNQRYRERGDRSARLAAGLEAA